MAVVIAYVVAVVIVLAVLEVRDRRGPERRQ